MMKLLALSAVALGLTPSLALAQNAGGSSNVTASISAGSLGIGPEIGIRPVPMFGIRANATFLALSHNIDVDDIDYDGDLKLRSFGAAADFYPFENNFRLSAGFRIDRNKIDLVATPSQSVTIGTTTYTPDQVGTIEGEIRAKKFAPTLTLGYAENQGKGFAWSFDAGVMFHGRPRTYDLVTTGQLATNPLFQADLARERAEIEDEVDNYKIYPIVQLALGYTF